ncbi:MAG: hypothetical protein IKU55_02440 [Clostridia bacterium]|nr:hypothetical protein [Clostridia bacterium]
MNDRPARLHVGMTTVVTVFAVLALSIFSVLTLVSAHFEYELAEISAKSIQNYYEAEATLADRVKTLCDSLPPTAEAADYVLAEPIDHARVLVCIVRADGNAAEILTWRVENAAESSPQTQSGE